MGVSLFKRSKPAQTPVPGSIYQRVIFNSIETARVLSVTDDGFPVPHVRFVALNDLMDGPGRPGAKVGVRTLTVDSFTRLYGQPVLS